MTEKETETSEPEHAETDERKTPAFVALTRQIKELREQLDSKNKAEEDARKKREQAELEAKGNYEAILKQRDSELESLKANFARVERERVVREALIMAGVKSAPFIKGAVADFSGELDAVGEYIERLKTAPENAPVFGIADAAPRGLPPAQSASPARAARVDWAQTKQDLTSGDSAKRKAAADALTAYALEHGGELPPGI